MGWSSCAGGEIPTDEVNVTDVTGEVNDRQTEAEFGDLEEDGCTSTGSE